MCLPNASLSGVLHTPLFCLEEGGLCSVRGFRKDLNSGQQQLSDCSREPKRQTWSLYLLFSSCFRDCISTWVPELDYFCWKYLQWFFCHPYPEWYGMTPKMRWPGYFWLYWRDDRLQTISVGLDVFGAPKILSENRHASKNTPERMPHFL